MQSNLPYMESQVLDASGESSVSLHRAALWVLYFSLISIYLILRFVVLGDRWPTRQDLQMELTWPAIGTAALLISSLTIFMAQRAAASDQVRPSRLCLMVTLALAIGFAVFQVSEYHRRWMQNLIPAPFSNSLHDRADLYYLSAVRQRLILLASEINTSKVLQNQLVERLQNLPEDLQSNRGRLAAELARLQAQESHRTQRLTVINRLLISEANWTSSVVATSDDVGTQRMAMAALAQDIRPHRAFADSHQQFHQFETRRLNESQTKARASILAAETSAKENSEPIKGLLAAVAELKAEHQAVESQLKLHLRQAIIDEEQSDAPETQPDAKRLALERQLTEVSERLNAQNAKLTAAAQLVTDAEDNAAQLSQELNSIAARRSMVDEMDPRLGLNEQYEWLHLPVCIPAGTSWAWTYYVLTLTHTLHLAYSFIGVLTLATLIPAGSKYLSKSKQIARNWQCMVSVWVILFVLIYLI